MILARKDIKQAYWIKNGTRIILIEEKDTLRNHLSSVEWIKKLAYFSDILLYNYDLNLSLQGTAINVFSLFKTIEGFKKK